MKLFKSHHHKDTENISKQVVNLILQYQKEGLINKNKLTGQL